MDVVNIGEERYLEAIRLSEYAFQNRVADEQLEERLTHLKKHQQLIGIIEEDALVAKLHFLPLEVYVGDMKIKMGGIAGVATYPEFRRNGFVKEMLITILERMRSEGYSISMLYPFSVPFYRRYGWELFSNRIKATMSKSDLHFQAATEGKIRRMFNSPPIQELNDLYETYAKNYSGMLVREQDWWEKIVKDQQIAIYYDQANQPSGYIMYTVKNKTMKVEELVTLNAEAKRGIWNYICQHDSMSDDFEIITHEKEPLLFSINEPRVKLEITPYFMARIVDVELLFKTYVLNWGSDIEELVLQVSDSYAAWNDKTFVLTPNKIFIEGRDVRREKSLHLSINALSTILFGYKTPSELSEVGQVKGKREEIEKFERLLPKRAPFFYDFF
ncbi:GNAT family N-acetyltransferase [Halalkalibacter lacteus]|uniref:GNAT family N-acetyltransferase n=1 Tax=Halalkalibacter lacteus TaxID=3090663 RepID=UPI002FC97E8D